MAAPLAGYIYWDPTLHGGHWFVVGPDDPFDDQNVIVFCCTSQDHGRPATLGCHPQFRLHSFYIPFGMVKLLTLPTWVILSEAYYYRKSDFTGKWRVPCEKLDLQLTVDILNCASESETLPIKDAERCQIEAKAIAIALGV